MSDASERNYRSQSEPIYRELADTEQFAELRRRYRAFVLPWTAAFLVWYLSYVVLSNWGGDFMNTKVIGNINLLLVFGLLQFVTTFGIAFLYARHSRTHLDPLARDLEQRYHQGIRR
ncbi:MAG: DUF485 domain-containing protein [Nocardioides alkalitolerans]|jgi:uncharacterized membrane protein (DUF485 family)